MACCGTCRAIYCSDLLQDRRDHTEFHGLVVRGDIPFRPIGQGPWRSLRGEITRARARLRKERRRA